MEKHIHDQQHGRHIIMCPIPFTEKQLIELVREFNGFDDETTYNFVQAILEEGSVMLNPSSSIGEGANFVDIFNFGYMALMKHAGIDVDPATLWIHPCRSQMVTKITSIEFEKVPCEVISNEAVMMFAYDANSGSIVSAQDAAGRCLGDSDNLESYGNADDPINDDDLPF